MIKTTTFQISFITTLIFLSTILSFLITDSNSKNINFKNSPSIFKIENINPECYQIEFFGNQYTIDPIKTTMDKNYKSILRACMPQNIKLIESFIYYSLATYNEIINYQKNIDYLNNIKHTTPSTKIKILN